MKNFFKVLLAMMLILTVCLSVVACNNGTETPDNGDETPHEHSYVNGKCECGESDPNYQPPVEGLSVAVSAESTAEAGFVGNVAIQVNNEPATEFGNDAFVNGLEEGAIVTLMQKAFKGYTFVGWFIVNGDGTYGDRISRDSEYTFELSENVTIVARYLNDDTNFMINVTAGGLGKVSVNGSEPKDSISYVASPMEELTITVTPDEYYMLDGWYVDDEIFSYDKTLTITAEGHIDIEARIWGKDVEFNFRITGMGKDVNKYGLDLGHDSEYFNIDGSYNTGTVFSRYGETVRIMPRPADGYSFVGFAIKHQGETTFVYEGYVEIPVTDIDSYEITLTFDEKVVGYGEKPIDIWITQFDSGYDREPRPGYYGCEDCCVYVNGHKFTGEGKITVNPHTLVTLVAFPCEECENFIYYKHNGSELDGYVATSVYTFTATTANASKSEYNNNYFNIEVCFDKYAVEVDFYVHYNKPSTPNNTVYIENTTRGPEEVFEDYYFLFYYGDTVKLTARPDEGARFDGWIINGEVIYTSNPYIEFKVEQFEKIELYALFDYIVN